MNDAEWKNQSPFQLFDKWLKEAKSTAAIREPTAMALATTGHEHGLANRIVLLKGVSEQGLVFYTNYESHKGRDLEETKSAAALFYWDPLAKQVRITGNVKRITREESEKYWASRPRESQLSQYISKQSQPVAGREHLEALVRKADEEFKSRPIPCPQNWGGYILDPTSFEFWESRPGRLHDRIYFDQKAGRWTSRRLYP